MDGVFDVLERYLPQPVVAVLAFGFNSLSNLVPVDQGQVSASVQSWLPLLVTLCTVYWVLSSVFRTASFAVRTAVFFIKYGAVFGLVAALVAYVQNPENAPAGMFGGQQRNTPLRRSARLKAKQPRAWDKFDKHTQWRKETHAHMKYDAEVEQGRRVVDGVVNYVWDTVQRFAWDRTLGNLLNGNNDGELQEQNRKNTRSR